MAAAQSVTPVMGAGPGGGDPEIYFSRPIDNSRLVKVENPQKSRQMRQFGVDLACLFVLVMTLPGSISGPSNTVTGLKTRECSATG